MITAMYAEIRDLISRGKYRAVRITELPDGSKMTTAMYVLVIKSSKDKEDKYEARYVAGVHFDITNDYLVHRAQTI